MQHGSLLLKKLCHRYSVNNVKSISAAELEAFNEFALMMDQRFCFNLFLEKVNDISFDFVEGF